MSQNVTEPLLWPVRSNSEGLQSSESDSGGSGTLPDLRAHAQVLPGSAAGLEAAGFVRRLSRESALSRESFVGTCAHQRVL